MPRPRGRPSPFQALAGGFAGGIGQGLQYGMMRRLLQEKEGKQDILSALKDQAKWTAEVYDKESPEYRAIARKILAEIKGVPQQQRPQVPQLTGVPAGMPPLRRIAPSRVVSRAEIAGQRAEEAEKIGATRIKEEKVTLRRRAEQLMKQRRDFLRGDPIMTALGGLIEPQWSDETEGVELNNILSDLRLKHRFTYPKSVMDALKLTAPKLGPPALLGLQREMRDKETGEIVNMRWDGTEWVKIE